MSEEIWSGRGTYIYCVKFGLCVFFLSRWRHGAERIGRQYRLSHVVKVE